MLSLLTGAPMSAAEVARELGLTHANASYHLRQLLAAGLLVVAGEETIRGGRAKRYRYDVDAPGARRRRRRAGDLLAALLADELLRRSPSAGLRRSADQHRRRALGRPRGLGRRLDLVDASALSHAAPGGAAAAARRAPLHVSVTLAMFAMDRRAADERIRA